MQNKIFVAVVCLVFVFIFAYAPIHSILMAKGLIPYENVGNEILVEKTYDKEHPLSDLLNGIEEGKRTITDTYTNHIPLYLKITDTAKAIKRSLNNPLSDLLTEKSNEIAKQRRQEALDKLKKK